MVNSSDTLDTNSPYFYALWFRDFSETSVVAAVDDEIVGFLIGYRIPEEPDVYFVWQEAVKPRHGIPDLGVKILDHAVDMQVASGASFVETTTSADNKAILMVIGRFSRARSAKVEKTVLFPRSYFPGEHHDEILHRIGPLTAK